MNASFPQKLVMVSMESYTSTLAFRALCALYLIIGLYATYRHFQNAKRPCTFRALSIYSDGNSTKVHTKCTTPMHFQTPVLANRGRLLAIVHKMHKVRLYRSRKVVVIQSIPLAMQSVLDTEISLFKDYRTSDNPKTINMLRFLESEAC